MVSDAGATTRPGHVRALKLPRPIDVTLDQRSGEPRTMCERGRCHEITGIQDSWRATRSWWREPTNRHYLRVVLGDGTLRTIFHDVIGDRWFAQGR
jgi:hypothetical protein